MLFLILQGIALGQVNKGYVFVSNDYRNEGRNDIIVKWVANKAKRFS